MAVERNRPKSPWVTKALLVIVLVLLYLPIAVMLGGAVTEKIDGQVSLTLRWLGEVFSDPQLMGALQNSLVVAVATSLLATSLGTLGALALHSSSRKMKLAMNSLSLVSLIFPEIVFALSLLSLFFILRFELGLVTVVIAHVSFSISYVMMTVNARLASLDPAIEDAARDLGASEWVIIRTVVLPLLKPAIAGGFILSFLLSFDDFLITYFVNGVGRDTLPVKLYTAMKMGISPKLNALSSVMFLITVVALIFFFRSSAFRVLLEGQRRNDGEKDR
ncbi:ABC transporter permease [Bdellovibrio sp. HCB2-146]|uniref:ABC transporter permease n=1 Tax=Bdellovibrio sp. HCB2-146 TaxID=3394362 RepID=UPI0039BCF135